MSSRSSLSSSSLLVYHDLCKQGEADIQNEEKHGQQADQPAEHVAINVPGQDKSSQSPKARSFRQIRKLLLAKSRLLGLDLLRMQMRGLDYWWAMIPVGLEVGSGLLIRL